MTTARTGLGIIWPFRSAGEREQVGSLLGEVPGFRLIGYWPNADASESLDTERFCNIWPERSIETRASLLHDAEDETVVRHQRVSVWIKKWPEAGRWRRCIEESLQIFVERGAALSWCEPEAGIVMYDPSTAFEGCYAAFTTGTGLICLGGLDDPLRSLDEEPIFVERLHTAVSSARRSGGAGPSKGA